MQQQCHVLNGDALREQFPQSLEGMQVVVRECLIEGDLQGETLAEFFEQRARYLANTYPEEGTPQAYATQTVAEFAKLHTLPAEVELNFWFEDDLFCQTNFWFCLYYLQQHHLNSPCFLVRPPQHTPYGFGGLSTQELETAFQQRTPLPHKQKIAALWEHYRQHDLVGLAQSAQALCEAHPYLYEAAIAHLERFPTEGSPGKPEQILSEIMDTMPEATFGEVFRAFYQRAAIYGFGDLQVKRVYDALLRKK